ncbi:MAG: hypothetical protein R3266_01255 [Gemmatimonadota bacterium]|nr:hypothetical protein [Gemmatimonadota bacterium]
MSDRVATTRHGPGGALLGLLTLVLPGALALTVALFRDVLPPGWLGYPPWMSEIGARILALALGMALLAIGVGYFRFRRHAWWGYLAWAAIALVQVVFAWDSRPGQIVIAGYPLLVVLGWPYLWLRRREFGIGRHAEAEPAG